ncbi:hypothetical protein AQUCO_00100124v1 [Aquilegia coerulea]|uniref:SPOROCYTELESS-like EAR-containing protein 2 n=1 Tax=Aquilegia coerulea TaxID=218851 RepID=A0A2G5F908_AQUCA|nr:hypothetical protein AQUCO_00100124v1 [Aquilegia coerulea]QBL95692.1 SPOROCYTELESS-like EAR-containing protein 2 [Aquilegia coerulea]
MATSFFFPNNGNTVGGGGGGGGGEMMNQENSMLLFGQPEIRKQRAGGKKNINGKVNNNSNNQKKQSQRGMGVEKLERLRMGGYLNKFVEIEGGSSASATATAASHHDPFLHHHHQFNFPFTYGGGSVTATAVHHVPFAAEYVGGHVINNNVYQVHQPVSAAANNLGFSPYASRFVNGGGFTMVPMTPNQFHQAPNKELSSIQINDSNYDNSWNKKKLINGSGGEVLEYDGEKTEMQINGCDSLALSLGLSNSNTTNLNLHDQEAQEVMKMHRKRNGGDAGRRGERVLMEYEFLPHHKGSSSSSRSNKDNTTSVSKGGLVLGHEASPTNNNNFLDLSLKLSCYN